MCELWYSLAASNAQTSTQRANVHTYAQTSTGGDRWNRGDWYSKQGKPLFSDKNATENGDNSVAFSDEKATENSGNSVAFLRENSRFSCAACRSARRHGCTNLLSGGRGQSLKPNSAEAIEKKRSRNYEHNPSYIELTAPSGGRVISAGDQCGNLS